MKRHFKSILTCRKRTRDSSGITLTELVMSTVLLGFSMAVMAEIMSLSTIASTKLDRQFDAQAATRIALDRIKQDVRMSFRVCPGYSPGGGTKRCPLTEVTDCNHGISELTLGPRTLVLHLPIYFLDKVNDQSDPLYVLGAGQNPNNGVRLNGFDTAIYNVLPDADDPGKYKLVYTLIPGPRVLANCSYRAAIDQQTLARGIVGPVLLGAALGTTPETFKFLSKNPQLGKPGRLDALNQAALQTLAVSQNPDIADGISGVAIDFEVSRGGTAVDDPTGRVSALHSEACLRISPSPTGTTNDTYYE